MRRRTHLHEIVELVLLNARRAMTSREIAEKIQKDGLWKQPAGSNTSPVTLISARIKSYPTWFERKDKLIDLTDKRKEHGQLRFTSSVDAMDVLMKMEVKYGMQIIEEERSDAILYWSLLELGDVSELCNFVNDIGYNGELVTTVLKQ